MASILIVDDDDNLRAGLVRRLTQRGHRTRQAANGRQAMALLQETAYEVILIDLYMPEKDGLETIPRIRKSYPDTVIIAMSGGGTGKNPMDLLTAARFLGANMAVAKPFDVETVALAIEQDLSDLRAGTTTCDLPGEDE